MWGVEQLNLGFGTYVAVIGIGPVDGVILCGGSEKEESDQDSYI